MKFDYNNIIGQVFGDREPRKRQIEFIEACFNAMVCRKPIVIEGPTGLGKSLAMICSFMPFVLKSNKRIIYTTRTISQLENFLNELKTVLNSKEFHDISVSLNVGRESTRKWACNQESCKDCPYNEEDNKSATNPRILDFQEMKKLYEDGICPYKVCRFNTSKNANIVLSTYSKVLNEGYRREYMGMPDKRENIILIFDEAHNFFEDVVDKPFIDVGYFEQDTVSDSPAFDLCELKYLLVLSFLKHTSRYVFDKLRQLISEEIKKINDLLFNTHQEIRTTEREIYFKSKDLKKKQEMIDLIEGTWIPEDETKLKDIKNKIRELKDERDSLNYKVDKLNSEIEFLQDDIDAQTNNIQQEYEQIKNMSTEISRLYDQKKSLIAQIKVPGSREMKMLISRNIDSVVADIDKLKENKSELYTGIQELKEMRGQLINTLRSKNKEKKKYENRIDTITYQVNNFKEKVIPSINANISNNLARAKELKGACKQLKSDIQALEILLLQLNNTYHNLQVEKDRVMSQRDVLEDAASCFFPNISHISKSFLNSNNIAFERIKATQMTELLGLHNDDYFKVHSFKFAEEAIDLLSDFVKRSIDFYNMVVGKLFDGNIRGLVAKDELGNLFSDLVFGFIDETSIDQTEEKLFSQIAEFNRLIENIITCPRDFVLETQEYNSIPCWSIYTLNPKQKIQETVIGCYSSVYLSATISPVETMAAMVSDDAVSCKIKSEFPVENYNCYGLIGINTSHKKDLKDMRFRQSECYILETALKQILSIPVSTGIFVSSKMVLNEIYPIITKICKEKNRYFFPGNDANIVGRYRKYDNYYDLCNKVSSDSTERDVGTKIKLIKHCAKLENPIPIVVIDITGGQMIRYNIFRTLLSGQ